MILDKFANFGATSAITSATTYSCADVMDLRSNTVAGGTQNNDIAEGRTLNVVFNVDTGLLDGTNATFRVVTSASDTLSSPTIIASTGAIATASLGAGKQVVVKLDPGLIGAASLRYLGAQVVTTGVHTAGVVSAFIVLDVQDGKKFYASGFTA